MVVDYGLNNLNSIVRALKYVNADVEVTDNIKKIKNAESLVLPGVGAYGSAMERLNMMGLSDGIKEYAMLERPLLGICLGMQLLFDFSEEFGFNKGLGLIKGNVTRIPNDVIDGMPRKVPHIGWNELVVSNNYQYKTYDFNNKAMYFVHSYMCNPQRKEEILANVDYKNIIIPAIINSGNIFGMQFHPEKSGHDGLKILSEYINF